MMATTEHLDSQPIPAGYEHLEDQELQRVQVFNDAISQVSKICVSTVELDLESEHPTDEAIVRFRTYDAGEEPTFFISEGLAQSSFLASENLSFEPRVSRGGKSTHHGVFFGNLRVGADQLIPVAVKPHETNPIDSCLRDYLNNDAVQKLGFYTPESVGYIISGTENEKTAYSLSLLDETLTTLEGINWSDFFPDTTQNPGMQEIWREVSQQIAIIHAHGNMSHGDLAPRNIATSAEGGVFIIDWEKANLSLAPVTDTKVSLLRSHSDLSILLESMCRPTHVKFKTGIGLFYGKDGDWWQGFCDIFFDEYCEVRRMEASTGTKPRQGGKQRLDEVEDELAKLTEMLKEDIQMYQETCATL
ncbi:MAG: lipopolysaccharide kinase InaA family protein [Candidatus Saccharimonadales bacterium]